MFKLGDVVRIARETGVLGPHGFMLGQLVTLDERTPPFDCAGVKAWRVGSRYVQETEIEPVESNLFAIDRPFGMLDKETQQALLLFEGQIQVYLDQGWVNTHKDQIKPYRTYRAVPSQYKPGKLYAWSGGSCPVAADQLVEVLYNGVVERGPASTFSWKLCDDPFNIQAFVLVDESTKESSLERF